MAKGNLFQGMGRGKIGDVVFSRLNGQQVSRVRNRNPKNPRSNAQLYQRAIMATIMQAYSAGKEIFDHSFQGKTVGANNMAVFMRENLKILRQQIAYEISSEMLAENMQANCVWPGANQPVANAYLISKGNYKQKAFIETRPGGGIYYTLPEPEANEKVNEYAARVGLLADDYYTFCLFLEGTNELFHAFEGLEDPAGIGYDCRFGYVRLHVKSNVASIEDAISTKSQLFDVDASMNIDETFMTENVAEGISMSDLDVTGRGVGSIGLIRSRKDRDLRSTSYMYCPTKAQVETNDFGIKSIYINEAWARGTESLGNSDLILEGGGAKPSPKPAQLKISEIVKCENESSLLYGFYAGVAVVNGQRVIPVVKYSASEGGLAYCAQEYNTLSPEVRTDWNCDEQYGFTPQELIDTLETAYSLPVYIISETTSQYDAYIEAQKMFPLDMISNFLYKARRGGNSSIQSVCHITESGPKAATWPSASVDRGGVNYASSKYKGNIAVISTVDLDNVISINATDVDNFTMTLGSKEYTVENGSIDIVISNWWIPAE